MSPSVFMSISDYWHRMIQRGDFLIYSISDLIKSKPVCSVELRGNKKAPCLRGKVNVYNWADGNVLKVEIVNIPAGAKQVELYEHTGFSAMLNVYNGYCYTVFFAGKLKDHSFKLKYNGSIICE